MAIVKTLVNARSRTATSASAKFAAALKTLVEYEITPDVDVWIKFDHEGGSVAASGDGALFLAGGVPRAIAVPDGGGVYLHVLRAAAVDGNVNIAEVALVTVADEV